MLHMTTPRVGNQSVCSDCLERVEGDFLKQEDGTVKARENVYAL